MNDICDGKMKMKEQGNAANFSWQTFTFIIFFSSGVHIDIFCWGTPISLLKR